MKSLITISTLCFLASFVFADTNGKNEDLVDILSSGKRVIHAGDISRIQAVLDKAEKGEDIVIGAIGGSITMGASARSPHNRYINLVAGWFKQRYPKVNVYLYNAAIGSTDSKFGAFRLHKHLLCYNPDLVIVEYSINDSANEIASETFEGIIRQLLKDDNSPAIIILALMNAYGDNVEQKHLPLARHYDITMLSLRSVFEKQIKDGSLNPDIILADSVHPNNTGHEIVAGIVCSYLSDCATDIGNQSNKIYDMPNVLITDKFDNVEYSFAGDFDITYQNGWRLQEHKDSIEQTWRLYGKPIFERVWVADAAGSEIKFTYTGTFMALTFWRQRADMGRIEVFIDGEAVADIDGWGEQQWGGFAQTTIINGEITYGTHDVCLRLSDENNEFSNGYRFELIGFGYGKK